MNPMASDKMCDFCTDPDFPDNSIFTCVHCGVRIHALCYGIEDEDKENWKCAACKNGCTSDVACEFCLQKNGALKPTSCGKWVHAVCAMFTDGVVFLDEDRMEPVDISKVSKSKTGQTCAYCHEAKGYCSLCSKQKCQNRIHIRCAQNANGTEEVLKADNLLKFRAYCADHKRANKRLSSGSWRAMARKMKADGKKLKGASSKMNADWILSQSIPSTSGNGMQNPALKQIQLKRKNTTHAAIEAPKKRWLNSGIVEGNFLIVYYDLDFVHMNVYKKCVV